MIGCCPILKSSIMGRGDIKTKKGKITAGSFGKKRPHKVAKKTEELKKEKPEISAS